MVQPLWLAGLPIIVALISVFRVADLKDGRKHVFSLLLVWVALAVVIEGTRFAPRAAPKPVAADPEPVADETVTFEPVKPRKAIQPVPDPKRSRIEGTPAPMPVITFDKRKITPTSADAVQVAAVDWVGESYKRRDFRTAAEEPLDWSYKHRKFD